MNPIKPVLAIIIATFTVATAFAQRTPITGSEETFNFSTTSNVRVVALNDEHILVVYKDGSVSTTSDLYARVGQVNTLARTITFGTAALIESESFARHSVLALSPTTAVVLYEADLTNDEGQSRVVTLDLSTDAITNVGSAFAFSSGDVDAAGSHTVQALAKLSSSSFAVAYADDENTDDGVVKIATVSGSSISYGSEQVFSTSDVQHLSMAALSPSTLVISYEDDGTTNDPGKALIGSISGTSVSFGSEYTFHSGAANAVSYTAVSAIGNDQFIVAYTEDGNSDIGSARVGTVSGTSITLSSASFSFESSQSVRDITMDYLTGTEVVLGWNGGSGQNTKVIIGEATGTGTSASISFSTAETVLLGEGDDSWAIRLNDDAFVMAYVDESDIDDRGEIIVGTLPNLAVWDGSTSTDWNTAANWSTNSVPTSTDNVIVPSAPGNQPQVTSSPSTPAVCADLTVENGATLTVDAGKALTINGNTTNNGTILVKADATGIGSLITEGSISGTGASKMEQYLTGSGGATPNGVFYYVSSPVNGNYIYDYNVDGDDKLWTANESTQSYTQQTVGAVAMVPTVGYIARMGSTQTITFNEVNANIQFNTGNQFTGSLTRTGTTELNRGYNLVGNPYPSTVDWNGLGRSNLETTIWYRTHNGSTMLFDTYNATGMIGTNNNGNGAVTGYIPPTQAFWVRVQADGNTGQVSFANTDRSHGTLAGIYKTEAQEGLVRMALSNGTISDEAIIMFDAAAQDGFDDHDSHKYWAANIPQLYMNIQEDTLVINGLNSTQTNPAVPLGMKIPAQGNYTMNASSITFTETPVHLEDTYLNVFQDLNTNPTYAFTSMEGNINDRFILHFSAITGVDEAESDILIYSSADQIYINRAEAGQGTVTVLDLSGRTILTEVINSQNATVQLNAPMGIYLVRVETETQTTTKKLTIR